MVPLRPIGEWLALLADERSPLARRLAEAHDHAPYLPEVLRTFRAVCERAGGAYGAHSPALLVRSTGRVNLLGMHIDHRGGSINPIAVRSLAMAVVPRADDRVEAQSVDLEAAAAGEFSIAAELPGRPIEDWEAFSREAARARAGQDPRRNWLNYLRAAVLYLANRERRLHPDRPALKGMNVVVGSTIPMAAGLSSSSALVVAAALAFMAVNDLAIAREDLVDICGEAEWFVGTRGGKGDHAAILFGRPGCITHIGFWPLRVETAPLPKGYRIVMANSLKEARKQVGARDAFNQRVASYVIGQMLLKHRFPNHAPRIEHLRDVNPKTLGVTEPEIYRMLLALPVRARREEISALLSHPQSATRNPQLEALFETHAEPPGGYPVRQVVLYAIGACLRSEMAPERLRRGDVAGFGELMSISHEGDRVTRLVNGRRVPVDHALSDEEVERLAAAAEAGNPQSAIRNPQSLWRQPGGYDASCPELDELVDIARSVPGVLGASLIGAGLGGSVVILAAESVVEGLIEALARRYYAPRNLAPAVEVCIPVEGAGVLNPEP